MSDLRDFTGKNSKFTGTDGLEMPQGTTAERPNPATVGTIRYNTDTGLVENYTSKGWAGIDAPPTITSVTPSALPNIDDTTVVAGSNFDNTATWTFIGASSTVYTPKSVTFTNNSSVTLTRPDTFPVSDEPFAVKVVNNSGLGYTLESAIDAGNVPIWQTASGSLGTFAEGASVNVTVQATDTADSGTISYSETTSALSGAGLSINSGTGAITGTLSSPGSDTTYNITIRATDSGGNTADRSFTISSFASYGGTIQSISSQSRTGPTSLGSTYSGTDFDGDITLNSGQQYWTVPYTGTYTIDAYGAQGGSNSAARGGGGARVKGDFSLTAGEVVRILVGNSGVNNTDNDCDRGGGGGTYVIRSPYNSNGSIAVIAAGGGGASNPYNGQGTGDRTNGTGDGCAGKDGQGGTTATSGNGGSAGTGGNAGTRDGGGNRGNPGGGFFSGGGSGSSNNTWSETSAGFSYLDGGAGGTPNDGARSYGGFGGGGGGHGNCFISGGGGGGYNGGGNQIQYTQRHGGPGGGSYNNGSNQTNTSGANYNSSGGNAQGRVVITRIS